MDQNVIGWDLLEHQLVFIMLHRMINSLEPVGDVAKDGGSVTQDIWKEVVLVNYMVLE